MHKKITFTSGLALMSMSLMFFTSCQKEEITSKKSVEQSKEDAIKPPKPHVYKFSTVVQIPGENAENGFLSLKVSSDDQKSLDEYLTKLEQCKLMFKEADPSVSSEEKPAALSESKSPLSLDFDWSNYHSNLPKGKLYECALTSKDPSKALTLQYTWTISSFTSTNPFACINIYITNNVWNTYLYLGSGSNIFFETVRAYHDNLEVRTFLSSSVPSTGFGTFTYNGTTVRYRPRLNYSSPELPSPYTDFGAITSGAWHRTFDFNAVNSDVRLYFAS